MGRRREGQLICITDVPRWRLSMRPAVPDVVTVWIQGRRAFLLDRLKSSLAKGAIVIAFTSGAIWLLSRVVL